MTNAELLQWYREQAHEALEWLDLAVQALDDSLDDLEAMEEEPVLTDAEMNRWLADAVELPARMAEIARKRLDKTRRKIVCHGLRTASRNQGPEIGAPESAGEGGE